MKKILFIFAHPNPKKSRANRVILNRVRDLPELTVHDLYETYPDYYIDVDREKKLLMDHDLIVFQHPFYWYSMPPLLKEWHDAVLEYGFAYGPNGTALRGKALQLSITAGGPIDSYAVSGYNHFPIEAFLPPYIQTAALCGMTWQEPLILNAAIRATDDELAAHAEHVRARLVSLVNLNYHEGP